MRRRRLLFGVLFGALPLAGLAQDAAALKSAIVVNMLQFVQWPEADLPAVALCADRQGPMWPHLAVLQQKGLRAPRALALKELPVGAEGLRGCHALMLENTPAARRVPLAEAVGLPLLVVGDVGRDDPGVVIALRWGGERFGFDVDMRVARRGGLLISSKLLRLAGKVVE